MASAPTPLRGIRVVSLAINVPGPLAVARLAELGADVTKVEPPTGDPLAHVTPTWYDELHAQVKVQALNLKDATERAALDDLLRDADILVTAQRPSALARLGLDNLEAQYPRLAHVEIVGHDGDEVEAPGHDLTYQAAEGTLNPPHLPTVPVADMLGAERAVSTALAALMMRGTDNPGGRHRVALADAAHFAGAAVRHGLMGAGAPLGGALPTYDIYATADGHVALGALEPHFAAGVHAWLGTTRDAIAASLATRRSAEWEELAAERDLPVTAVTPPQRHA